MSGYKDFVLSRKWFKYRFKDDSIITRVYESRLHIITSRTTTERMKKEGIPHKLVREG